MTYLIAKYALLFTLASLFGFLFGRWWFRRGWVDVTESHDTLLRLKSESERAPWDQIFSRIDGVDGRVQASVQSEIAKIPRPTMPKIPEVDLSGVINKLGAIESRFERIPKPEPINFATVNKRIDDLANVVRGIPSPPKPTAPTDLGPVQSRMDGLEKAIQAIRIPEPTAPTNLTPLQSRIDKVEDAIRSLPAPPKVDPVNLGPLQENISSLERAVASIPRPEAVKPIDLDPIQKKLEELNKAIQSIPQPEPPAPISFSPIAERIERVENRLANLPQPPAPKPVNFEPVNQRIIALERAIGAIPRPEKAVPLDLSPLERRLRSLEQQLANFPRPTPAQTVNLAPITDRLGTLERSIGNIPRAAAPTPPTDLSPVHNRLTAIEEILRQRPKQATVRTKPIPKKTNTQKATLKRPASDAPLLFKSAQYGPKDDLKRIKGVGPKLDRMLNRQGVYYFWQIAEWKRADIRAADERLSFKGRIDREKWVSQAKKLRRATDAAKAPASL